MTLATLYTLAKLQKEMAAAHRKIEEGTRAEVLNCLAKTLNRADDGTYTTGEAAERLGVSIPTVKRWIGRGVLKGVAVGRR